MTNAPWLFGRIMAVCILAISTLSLRAGMDNVVVSFSTVGPDVYDDGRQVLDGECYALCWTPTGLTFDGIDAEGNALGGAQVVLKAPVAKDAHCPNILFEIDGEYARKNFRDGRWSVVMLDTRRFATDQDGVILKGEDGLPIAEKWGMASSVVNGYGETGAEVAGSMTAARPFKSVLSNRRSVLPEKGRGFRIRDMKVVDGNVYLYVQGTLSSVRYGLRSGVRPDSLADDGERRYGKTDGDLVIIRPQRAGGEFFSFESVQGE